MIVKIAAWLYLINAALTLGSLTLGPFGLGGSGANLAVLLIAGLNVAMGVGLLQRKTWARWLALGNSFLGWTLGTLALVVMVGALFFAGGLARQYGVNGGLLSGLAVVAVIFVLIWLVGVVISFKLFWYLCSQEGCEEFDAPYGSAGTVVASCAAWVVIFITYSTMASGGLLTDYALRSAARSSRDSEGARRELERQHDEMLREHERDNAARRARIEEGRREAEQRAQLEAAEARSREQNSDSVEPLPARAENDYPVVERARAEEAEKQESSSIRILKCRDDSGGITFTQGYCPSGTKQVEMPASE